MTTETEEKINKIIGDENLQYEFLSHFIDEINSDEEPFDRKFRQITGIYYTDPDLVNDLLITLCGWSMDSLCDITLGTKK